jgi:GTPase
MTQLLEDWAKKIFSGDRRAVARAISAIEKREPAGRELLKSLHKKTGNAYVIGVTGSPGAGKSTLVEKLAAKYRASGVRVGIIAVDPTSPFSGGAILGDRIRMQALSNDQGVYIRSMATRGELGGLAPTTHDAVEILDAAGCGVVIIETVGVGQDEVEVARLADATVLLLVPGMGDDIQTFKAGVMEIADLFVINKSDHPGADRVEQEVLSMLGMTPRANAWQPPVLRTVATSGEGIEELRSRLDKFRTFGEAAILAARRREHCRARLLGLLRQELFEKVAGERLGESELAGGVEDVLSRKRDPHSVVEVWVAESTAGRSKATQPAR